MLENGVPAAMEPQPDKSREIRNARYDDFTDAVVEEYMSRTHLHTGA